MAEKKGIRVNALAKELGVESKSILHKLKEEGLGDRAPNHMSVIPLGLAESVREWFHHGHGDTGGTAVETAAPVEVATKPKTSRKKKTKADTDQHTEDDDSSAVAEAEHPEVEKVVEEPVARVAAPEAPKHEPVVEVKIEEPPVVKAPEPVVAPPPVEVPAIAAEVKTAPVAVPAPTPTPVAKPHAPATGGHAHGTPTPAAHPAPSHGGGHGGAHSGPPTSRPTVTLINRPNQPSVVERKAVTPAARMVPEPAKIQGPRVVREEKPDVVAAPRPRRPVAGQGPAAPTAFQPTKPQGGRGVRAADDTDEESDKKKAAAKKSGSSLSSRRRGPDGRRGEAMEKLKEYTEADLIERRDRLNAATSYRTGFDSHIRKNERRGTHEQAQSIVQRGEPVQIEEPITVRSLAVALGIKNNDIISKLMRQGVFATVNQTLTIETAQSIALEYTIELEIKVKETLEEKLAQEFDAQVSKPEDLVTRPPVVTILGHVDHGKTSLLDRIRKANVAAGEAGGITQHTAAWMVTVGEGDATKRVTFIDTPGHQAFTAMRARGANMTDVVVLVVSAAEGVQPQTIESINHAKAAGVPIVVAMNKIDRPDANEQKVLGELAAQGLNPVEWGGDIEVVRTSATTGQGIPELIEILDYQSQLLELKADPKSRARGTVIESRMEEGLGAVATVLVQNGTLKVGDIIVCGAGYGKIRSLLNDRMQFIQDAAPSTPVIVSGLDQLPNAGEKFYAVNDLERARAITEERQTHARQEALANKTAVTLDSVLASMKAGDIKTINLIVKGDVQGSVETLTKTVTDQNTEEVRVRVIHSAVGAINESDVELASASNAVIIGFHVVPDEAARSMAEQRHVEIRLYRVIYEIFDDLKKALSGMLEPEIREKLHGHVEIRQVFKVSRIGNIAGCMVTDGHIQRGSKIRLIRDGVVVTEDLSIETLKRGKDDVKEVKSGFECGIKLAGYDDIKIGDRLEGYIRETFQRTL